MMDRFHAMGIFVAVAEEQGFAAAARRLHLSPPAVTRAISALESELGVKLLDRTTRFVRCTEAGLRYLEDVRRILLDVATAEESVVGKNAEPRGPLTVTAPVLFGQMFVMPGIVEYLRQYPQTQIDAVFLDRVVNMLEEGIDVGIRIGELPDSSLRARRVGTVRAVLCATPRYLHEYGTPQHPKDPGRNYLYIRLLLSRCCRVAFLGNSPAIACETRPAISHSGTPSVLTR